VSDWYRRVTICTLPGFCTDDPLSLEGEGWGEGEHTALLLKLPHPRPNRLQIARGQMFAEVTDIQILARRLGD
jgi:hypothetical protein